MRTALAPATTLHHPTPGVWGDHASTPCCSCITPAIPQSQKGVQETHLLPQQFGTEGKLLFSPAYMSLLRPWHEAWGHWQNLGEKGVGAGLSEPLVKQTRSCLHPLLADLRETMLFPAAIITDYMPFACCIKAACLINIILKGGLGMRETSCFELQ